MGDNDLGMAILDTCDALGTLNRLDSSLTGLAASMSPAQPTIGCFECDRHAEAREGEAAGSIGFAADHPRFLAEVVRRPNKGSTKEIALSPISSVDPLQKTSGRDEASWLITLDGGLRVN